MRFTTVVTRFSGALGGILSAPVCRDNARARMPGIGGTALILTLVAMIQLTACGGTRQGTAPAATSLVLGSPTMHREERVAVTPTARATTTSLWTAEPERKIPTGRPSPELAVSPTPVAPTGDQPTGNGPLQVPVRIRIPRIGVDAPVEIVGLEGDGTMSTPRSFEDVGWYGYSPVPGDAGTAVIAGHVDSVRGPAVFWSLRDLRAGDQIEVDLTGSSSRRFIVEGEGLYLSNEAPLAEIFSWAGRPLLDLITCEGVFDPSRHAYDKRLVVYAHLDIEEPPGGSRSSAGMKFRGTAGTGGRAEAAVHVPWLGWEDARPTSRIPGQATGLDLGTTNRHDSMANCRFDPRSCA